MLNLHKKYEKRLLKYNKLLQEQNKCSNIISIYRLITFLAGLIITILFFVTKYYYLCISSALAVIILFSFLVYFHNKLQAHKNQTNAFIEINKNSLKKVNGDWKDFSDSGKEFIDMEHRYSYDLDIFGEGSLFQWINTSKTYIGRLKLKNTLTTNMFSKANIYSRQQAINELSPKLFWRQKLICEGITASNIIENPEELINWSKSKNTYTISTAFRILLIILPIITILSTAASFISNYIPYYVPTLFIIIQLLILKIKSESRALNFAIAEKYSKNIRTYTGMLKLIEKQKYKSSYLKDLQDKLFDSTGVPASTQIIKLLNITETISSRHNMAYAVLDLLFMIDYHIIASLESWKSKYGHNLENWLDTIGEIEALSSLSAISYDNPNWVMPTIYEGSSYFSAEKMGHPLLGNKRICNDVHVYEPKTVLLITGSNMSGKSTLLRTVGINLVLAYAGAPVCAGSFCCSIMNLYSCMRVNDNLEKSISSFYAEIIKIRNIVKASNNGEKVFFLLDEIFKGTNSLDRHTGAAILIKQLSSKGNLGLVSTHDFELADLEKENNSKIINYHFEEYYKDDKIHFDYKLKSGISQTRNAIYLMKLAGIDVNNL